MKTTPTNSDDMIDSRDVIARIEELESERSAIDGDADTIEDAESIAEDLAAWDADNAEELAALKSLEFEAEGYADDWRHGCALIRDDYWPEYAEQFTKDVGGLPSDTPPWLVVDWEATAENLKVDYTAVEFDGVTYWVR